MQSAFGVAGRLALTFVLLVAAAGMLRFMYGPPLQPVFRNFGLVQTSIGVAVVACGGEAAPGCGIGTALIFASCSPQWRAYFAVTSDPSALDALVRVLIRKPPPSGNRWAVYCGGADAMLQDAAGHSFVPETR